MHEQLKTTIDNVCRSEGLNHSELSILIGKSRQYIGRIYRLGCSDKVAEQTMDSIAVLLAKDLNVISKLQIGIELLPEVTEIIEKTKLEIEAVKAENEMLRKQDSYRVQFLDKRNDLLANTVKHLQTVLNERTGELEKAKEHIDLNKKLFNELKKTEGLAIDMDKTIKHQSSVIRGNNATIESLRGSGSEVDYWIDKCERQYKINAFMGWCILALLIVIGVVWFL